MAQAVQPKSTVLITGASSGIGATYADRFAKRGHDLVLVARDAARLNALATRLRTATGVKVDVLPADLSVTADLAKVEKHLRDDAAIGILVNNAGMAAPGGFADGDPYDGIAAGKVDLWAWDHYHASIYGYYLEALMDFGKVTGKDPLSLGDNETVAEDMGFSKPQTHALEQIAHDQLAATP